MLSIDTRCHFLRHLSIIFRKQQHVNHLLHDTHIPMVRADHEVGERADRNILVGLAAHELWSHTNAHLRYRRGLGGAADRDHGRSQHVQSLLTQPHGDHAIGFYVSFPDRDHAIWFFKAFHGDAHGDSGLRVGQAQRVEDLSVHCIVCGLAHLVRVRVARVHADAAPEHAIDVVSVERQHLTLDVLKVDTVLVQLHLA